MDTVILANAYIYKEICERKSIPKENRYGRGAEITKKRKSIE